MPTWASVTIAAAVLLTMLIAATVAYRYRRAQRRAKWLLHSLQSSAEPYGTGSGGAGVEYLTAVPLGGTVHGRAEDAVIRKNKAEEVQLSASMSASAASPARMKTGRPPAVHPPAVLVPQRGAPPTARTANSPGEGGASSPLYSTQI